MLLDCLITVYSPEAPELDQLVADADPDRLRGVRILLVEDNEINQQIAVELLEAAGAYVHIAANGREALNILMAARYATSFDLVLSDLQMPEMDGYELAQRIRADPKLRELPIVAMTAHAIVEERKRCYTVGMNDHVSKPIDPEALLEAVGRQCGRAAAQSPGSLAPQLKKANQEFAAALAMKSGLRRVGGRSDLHFKLLKQFREQYGSAAIGISDQLAAGDLTAAELGVHSVRGVAANLGLESIAAAAHELENAIRRPPGLISLDALVQTLSDALMDFCAQFPRSHEGIEALDTSASETPVVERTAAIEEMLRKLWAYDPAAIEMLQRNRSTFRELLANDDFDAFEANVDKFSFSQAHFVLERAARASGPVG
jgi:two-component system, sensor histidine kinase and response regulator